MSRWQDPRADRDVVVLVADSTRDWPDVPPTAGAKFCLLLLAEHLVDAEPLLHTALDQGMVFACAWGPGCELVEDTFDEIIVAHGLDSAPSSETILTTSHPEESLEEALEFFLEAVAPAAAHVAACKTWVVFPVGATCRARVELALSRRGARRQP
jgi:hypothetical protein